MSSPRFAQGTEISVDPTVGSSSSYTVIPGVKNISGPSLRNETVDATTHDSQAGFRVKHKGLKDGGQVQFQINFDPEEADHIHSTGILEWFDDGDERSWRIQFKDYGAGTRHTWTFLAIVVQAEPGTPVDNLLTLDVTLEVTGPIAYSAV